MRDKGARPAAIPRQARGPTSPPCPTPPTIGELFKLKHVTDEQIDAAVRDYLNDPTHGTRLIAEGVALDLAAVVLAHPYVREVLARENAPEAQQRNAVRTAILLARRA